MPHAGVTPRVSVVIPTLGQSEALERAICSVLDQDLALMDHDPTPSDHDPAPRDRQSNHPQTPPVQIIVVDDGRNPESNFVIDQYADGCTRLTCSNNKGPAQAIQLGLDAATAPIVGVLMPTDILMPGALHGVLQACSAGNGSPWLVLDGIRITCDGHRMHSEPLEAPGNLQSLLLHQSGDLPFSGAFFRTALIRDQAAIDIDLPQAYAYEYACRLMAQGVTPAILTGCHIARRQPRATPDAQAVINTGIQILNAANAYYEYLPLRQRAAVCKSLDERARIYTLAESEVRASSARGLLWRQLLRHPWWLADKHYRHGLIHGLHQATTPPRLAA